MSLYQDLGVDENASQEEIKKAYRSEAQKSHPDREGGNKEKFNKIALAYSVLSDPKRRRDYDKDGTTEKKRGPDQKAEQVIYMWLNEILDKEVLTSDIVGEIKTRISSGREKLIKNKDRLDRSLEKYSSLVGRVSGGTEENIFDNAVKKKISDCKLQLGDIKENLDISDRMYELIEGYEDSEKGSVPDGWAVSSILGGSSKPEQFGRMSSKEYRDYMFGR